MKIEELNKALGELKSKVTDETAIKQIDLIIEGGKTLEKTFTDQFGELKDVKGSLQELRKAFEIDENTPVKDVSTKVKEKLEQITKEKESLGQSADDQVKTLADLKTQLENLTEKFNKSQDDIKVKDEQLADKELSTNIRDSYKGDPELYSFAEPKIKELIRGTEGADVTQICSQFLEDNPRFQEPEQKPGPGGNPPGGKPEENSGTLLSVMQGVTAESNSK
jgi:uncharacterized phage infection (PIP) family protein YhgE